MVYRNEMLDTATGGSVTLGLRVDIMPSRPLPDLNGVGGPAFAARLRNDAASDLMAILCNSGLPPRMDVVTAMRNVDHPGILRLIESGVVYWPLDDTRYYAFAFQRPLAPRMLQSLSEPHPPMTEDAVNHYFVAPMIGVLSELARVGVTHNGIRPTNIFWRTGGATPPQLGECMSGPAGIGQPVLFEPVERAMSLPIGRGTGSHADDCYAFGVTLALLVMGQNPMNGMDDNAILKMKIERSSFGALIGTRRLSASHIELLRGLLTDDARQRWTAADLELWLSGRRLTPKNNDAGRRASRHLSFGGKEYLQILPLTMAMAQNVGEAVATIENGALSKWLKRALGDEQRADDLEAAVNSLKQTGKTVNYEEQLVARTCIALDPAGPIRYRGLAVMPFGIGAMLVEAIMTGNNIQSLSEIISTQLVTLWVELQKEIKTDLVPLGQQYERMHGLIEKATLGNGIERVMYELNPGLPCLSPILRAQYVTTPKAMMPALERMAAAANRPREPMDRHIAAFLVVRDRRSETLFEAMMVPESSSRRGLALLTLYSDMQYRHGPDSLPGLAQWLASLLEPAVQRYLGLTFKEKLQKEIRETATRGDLGALLRLVDDPRRIEYDQQEFMAARMLYLNILKEVAFLEGRLANRNQVVHSTGKPMAATISSFLAILFVCAAVVRAVWQGLGM